MRNLAYWGRKNKNAARLIIIISYVFLNSIAFFLGDILHSIDIVFSPMMCAFAIMLTLIGWMLYPSKSRKNEYKNFFVRQKSDDFVLISASFLFIVYFGNRMNTPGNSILNPVQAISIIHPSKPSIVKNNSTAKISLSKKSSARKSGRRLKISARHIRIPANLKKPAIFYSLFLAHLYFFME